MQRLAAIAPPEVRTVWGLLSAIPDPEVPVLTITDLGMVRRVERLGDGWVIGFTPTYSGCPATEHLLGEIRTVMTTHGYTPVHIVLQLDPPWTTDWMSPDARERLRQYGARRMPMPATPARCQRMWSAHAAAAPTAH